MSWAISSASCADDDAPFTSTISIAEAHAIIEAGVRPIERTEAVPLADANGRVLATDVVAAADVPPFDRASMDGYAVIAADTAGATRESPLRLELIGRVYTGEVPTTPVLPGTCVEIATGAPMPAGADAVIMVEETQADPPHIAIHAAVRPRQNIGPRGADIATGDTVLSAGAVLNASRIGAIAALGHASVEAWARPSVAILSTGNEIAEQGQPLRGCRGGRRTSRSLASAIPTTRRRARPRHA
ncbi:MAG: hypothetical protein R2712_15700 [Vicinamibacterales bacterium]